MRSRPVGAEIEIYSTEWYLFTSGSLAICCLLHLGAFVAWLGGRFLLWKFRLCLDRGCALSLTNGEDEGEGDDEDVPDVNTKQVTQHDLNTLYSGPAFDGALVQSHVNLLLFVTIMYSAAMPCITIVCLICVILLYLVSKLFITKYAKHSVHFTETVVTHGGKVLSLAVFGHLLLTWDLLRKSPALIETEISLVDFDNGISAGEQEEYGTTETLLDLHGTAPNTKPYTDFIWAMLALYIINLLVINVFTCFFLRGCCTVEIKERTN
jgi:hypothetical protein